MYVAFLGSGMQVLPWNVPSRVFTGSGLRSPSAATVFLIRPLSALVGRGWRVLLLATSLLLELALGEGRGVSLNFSPFFPPFKKKWYLGEKLHLSGVYMPGAVCTRLVCTSNVFVIGSSGLKWKETCREQAISDSLVAAQCCSFAEWTLAGNPLTAGFGDFFFPQDNSGRFHTCCSSTLERCVCVCVCLLGSTWLQSFVWQIQLLVFVLLFSWSPLDGVPVPVSVQLAAVLREQVAGRIQ